MVHYKSLVGLLIIIFAKKSLKGSIREVWVAEKKLGFNNNFANKGAVAIRVDIDNWKFGFINWHLESGSKNLQKRIKQITELHKKGGFISSLFDSRETAELNSAFGKPIAFDLFDYLFISGDLNFRIKQQEKTLQKMIEDLNYPDLAKFDELINLRLYNDDLKKYKEFPIRFQPSYKIKPRSSPIEYEYSKGRLPSYWDRILYKPNPDISWSLYDWGDYTISDHLPVIAQFDLYIENTEILDNEDYRLSVWKDNIQWLNLERNTSQVPMNIPYELSLPEEDEIELPGLFKHYSEQYSSHAKLEIEQRPEEAEVSIFILWL